MKSSPIKAILAMAVAIAVAAPLWAAPPTKSEDSHAGHDHSNVSRAGFDFEIWERVPIQNKGLERSLYTFAKETITEATGKEVFNGRSAMENMFWMAFEPQHWLQEPFVKINRPEIRKVFNNARRISPADLEAKRPEWQPLMEKGNPNDEVHTEMGKVFGRANQLMAPAKGLAIIPTQDFRGQKDKWLTIEELAGSGKSLSVPETKLVTAWATLQEAFLHGDANAFNSSSLEAISALKELGVPTFNPSWQFGLDRWMSKTRLFSKAGWIYLLSTLIFMVSYLSGKKLFTVAASATLGVGVAVHTTALVVWGLLAGRTPVSNLFEASVFIIGCMAAISLVISAYYKTRIVGLAGASLGAFFMGFANTMPLHYGRQMLPLVDALQSYWLHLHVTSMLASYAFFAISFFVSGAYLFRRGMLARAGMADVAADPTLGYLDGLNFRIITIGFPVLTGGVILGAVWASEAWGRPWGFDPKETAAAITWMIYALYLHCRLFLGWKGTKGMWLSMIGAAAVLFTYLGVSFFLPGLHSYVSSGDASFIGFLKRVIPGI